ncbi:MAG: hypothetical protein KAQ68_00875 [Clostridiales bacterium]|nr:hypothetical protein [Clostridiales bacterium]
MFEKKRIYIVIALIMLVALIYFAPRLYYIIKINDEIKKTSEIEEVFLTVQYEGKFVKAEGRGIEFNLPIYKEDYLELLVDDDPSSTLDISGYGYDIIIRRNIDKPVSENIMVRSNISDRYLDCESVNEYKIKNLNTPIERITIFHSKTDLADVLQYYRNKNTFVGSEGNKYTTIVKDNFIFVVLLKDKILKGEGFDLSTILVYDISENYDLVVDIQIFKVAGINQRKKMKLEDVAFILNSLSISEYDSKQ